MVSKKALLGLIGVLAIGGGLIAACTKEQQQVVKDIVRIADNACVVIRRVGPNGILQEICAYEEELSPLVPVILTGRAVRASRSVDGGQSDALPTAVALAVECKSACTAACQ